jgi:cobalt-zinc-cadmium efflux system membrane fusion protein
VSGLKPGEPIVTQGAFHLKSILAGGELGEE